MFMLNIAQSGKAGSGRTILHLVIPNLAGQNRACATIAFAATYLCTRKILLVTYKIEQQHPRRQTGADLFVVEDKLYQNDSLNVELLKLLQTALSHNLTSPLLIIA